MASEEPPTELGLISRAKSLVAQWRREHSPDRGKRDIIQGATSTPILALTTRQPAAGWFTTIEFQDKLTLLTSPSEM